MHKPYNLFTAVIDFDSQGYAGGMAGLNPITLFTTKRKLLGQNTEKHDTRETNKVRRRQKSLIKSVQRENLQITQAKQRPDSKKHS